MQRLILTLFGLTLSLVLVACGSSTSPAGTTPGDSSAVVVSGGASGGPPEEPLVATAVPEPTAAGALRLDELTHTRNGGNGNVTFAGLVVNGGEAEIQIQAITIELYDATGQRISRITFANPAPPMLKPGEATPWQGQATELAGEWHEVRGTVVVAAPAAAR